MKVLVTGARGYVGEKVLALLKKHNIEHVAMVREEEQALDMECPVVVCDVLLEDSLEKHLEGITHAVYLIHSLAKEDYSALDTLAAERFASACESAHVESIVYLGGLGHPEKKMSEHLESRLATGDVLRKYTKNTKVLELRASVILGAGSLSFEMIRALTERLPVMIIPKWVKTPLQPIGIDDVLAYIYQALCMKLTSDQIYEIGGADVTSYEELMQEYARLHNLRRWMIPVPVLTPFLSSLWLSLITPLYANVGRKLVESATVSTTVQDTRAQKEFTIKPQTTKEALKRAVEQEEIEIAEHKWSHTIKRGHFLVDCRRLQVSVTPEEAFFPIQTIGGKRGWYYANFLWEIRGWMDQLVGGPGLRRGRKDPYTIQEGEALDFWQVKTYIPSHQLTLKAEMKVPGKAFLSFEVNPCDEGAEIFQTAVFQPRGVLGLLYWYVLLPMHCVIFQGMLKRIGELAIQKGKEEKV